MLWTPILLNFNHSLLNYNHSQVIHSLLLEAKSGVTFLGQSFSLYMRKLQHIIMLLHLSVSKCTLLQNDDCTRIVFVEFVSRLLSGGWQYSHANKSNTATAKDVKQNYSIKFAM